MTMALVLFAWIFFRANDIGDAYLVVTRLLTPMPAGGDLFAGVGAYEFWLSVAGIVVLEAVHAAQRTVRVRSFFDDRPAWVRWSFYYAGVMTVLLFAKLGAKQFIYFQF